MRAQVRILWAIVAILASASSIYARDKAFDRQWTHLNGPVYYQCATPVDKMPMGSTIFSLYGFDKNTPVKADFFLSGNIINADKQKKDYDFLLDKAHLVFTDGVGMKMSFTGDLRCTVVPGDNKRIVFTFYPGSGTMVLNNTTSKLIEEGIDPIFWNTDSFTVTVSPAGKTAPAFFANCEDLNLPKSTVLSRPSKANLLNEVLTGRNRSIPVKGTGFAKQVLKNPSRADISNFPEYKEYVTRYYNKDRKGVVRTVVDSIDLGEKIVTPTYEARIAGDAVNLTFPRFGSAGYIGDRLDYMSWNSADGTTVYRNDTLYRHDGSKLVGISFDEKAPKENGYMVSRLGVIESIADPALYDFTDAARASGLKIKRFISRDGSVDEALVDNAIPSVVNRLEMQRSFIGPDRTMADVRGRAKKVTVHSTDSDDEAVYTFDRYGYFTGPVTNYASINSAFSGEPIKYLKWEDLGHDASSTVKVKSSNTTGLNMDYTVNRNGAGYISEVATTSSPGYEEYDGSTTFLWANNRLARSWTKGWENEPTTYRYDNNDRLVSEVYTGHHDNGGKYVWTYTYGDADNHDNWLHRTVNFTFTPRPGSDEAPVSRSWQETRVIEYY